LYYGTLADGDKNSLPVFWYPKEVMLLNSYQARGFEIAGLYFYHDPVVR
jgi:hypothetical protein